MTDNKTRAYPRYLARAQKSANSGIWDAFVRDTHTGQKWRSTGYRSKKSAASIAGILARKLNKSEGK